MGNERLRTAMAKARVDIEAVTNKTGVDPKTVQRWLDGRVPHARHRWAVSALVSQEETYLWPETTNTRRSTEASKAELVELYPFRSAVPASLWWDLFSRAEQLIGVPGIEIHLHRTTLYNSIYRADDDLLINAHMWGVNAYSAPVTHLRRLVAGSLFDTYAASFEAVWAASEPAPSLP